MRFSCGSFSLDLPREWQDTSEETGPFTLSKPEGVGALQFSVAIHHTGPKPNPDMGTLSTLLSEFAEAQSLGEPSQPFQQLGEIAMVGSSYHPDKDTLVRAWYLSDGANFAKATYVCDSSNIGSELTESESIVKSFQFTLGGT